MPVEEEHRAKPSTTTHQDRRRTTSTDPTPNQILQEPQRSILRVINQTRSRLPKFQHARRVTITLSTSPHASRIERKGLAADATPTSLLLRLPFWDRLGCQTPNSLSSLARSIDDYISAASTTPSQQ
ncbi:hypothetical protein ASPCAL14154 [Aspergillus calidoustus]|uniref:Uncharacterized protein n=1 Tax=Aspergillus calidoustus TaxID=454130 RepID=A0A0U5GHX3_ASPCI|nr:hypothetical protein ASPCAL14154 [Aspergillus calidoustus]